MKKKPTKQRTPFLAPPAVLHDWSEDPFWNDSLETVVLPRGATHYRWQNYGIDGRLKVELIGPIDTEGDISHAMRVFGFLQYGTLSSNGNTFTVVE